MGLVPGLPQRAQDGPGELAEDCRVDDHDGTGVRADQRRQLGRRAVAHDDLVGPLAADADPGEGHRDGPGRWAAISATICSGARSSVLTVSQASFS